MDPKANLEEQLALAASIMAAVDAADEETGEWELDKDDATRLAELVIALDEWRRKGGFDPYKSQKGS
jgi:hypothetical protein